MKRPLSIILTCVVVALTAYLWLQAKTFQETRVQLEQTRHLLDVARTTNNTLQTEKQTLADARQTLQTQLETKTLKANNLTDTKTQLATTQRNLLECQVSLREQRLPPPPAPLAVLPSPATEITVDSALETNVQLESYLLESLQTPLGTEKAATLASERLEITEDNDLLTRVEGVVETLGIQKTLYWKENKLSRTQLEITGTDALEEIRTSLTQLSKLQPFEGKETLFLKDSIIQLTQEGNRVTLTREINFLRDLPMITQ
jgi:hypothetical protein